MTPLRSYQSDIYARAREAIAVNRAICIQLATGAGKTPIMAAMCESVLGKNKRAWIVVSRKELLTQASSHLARAHVPHGIINADTQESRAYRIHVVSKDTLIRRYDRIKNWPDLLLFDEAHLYLDRQLEIISHLPESSKIIGMTATPERADGRGLSRVAGGVYDALITGPSIPWLTERGFLTPLRYFAPPIEGLSDLHVRGTDYDEEELEALLQRRKIYGELVGHYEKHGKGKPALIFCRSVKSAYQTAERFRDRGFNFHCIEGGMSDTRRRELIAALTSGAIDGLTNCEIATYGLDIPRVEYGAIIRPTFSRALYMQAIGRILRPFTDPVTGRPKTEALFFDHVNNILEHQDDRYPGVPLHYVPDIAWNFDGRERRKRTKSTRNVVLCPHLDFMYCTGGNCRTCPHNPDKTVADARRPMVVIPAELVEAPKIVPLHDRPIAERREVEDRIGAAVAAGAIAELLKIADELGYRELWVYHRLVETSRHSVNVTILHEIARIRGYKPGWAYFAAKKIKAGKSADREYREVMG